MKLWPAIDVSGLDTELLLAEVDDFSPAAVEEHDDAARVFFSTAESRDSALHHLASRRIDASPVDVADEDWARRSQENITPISVGRIIVAPPWHAALATPPAPPAMAALLGPPAPPGPPALMIVIEPSMGFGTGHHATTRLCLAALQEIDVTGKDVVDVGTGSGVLAIAASLLGARTARGIDNDPDAIQNARENLALNPSASGVRFDVADLAAGLEPAGADILTANLTGALLQRSAGQLLTATRPGGTIVLSGLMTTERSAVEAAFSSARQMSAREEGEWMALVFENPRRR